MIGAQSRLFGSLRGPSAVALDAEWIYATEYEGGTIVRYAKQQDSEGTVLVDGLAHPLGLLADETNLYWLERGTAAEEDAGEAGAAKLAAIRTLAKSGGVPVTLPTGEQAPVTFTLRGGRIYWADEDGKVAAMNVDGTSGVVLAQNQYSTRAIVSDGQSVLWSTASDIRALSLAGGAVSTLQERVPLATSLALDETRLFWVTSDEVWSAPR